MNQVKKAVFFSFNYVIAEMFSNEKLEAISHRILEEIRQTGHELPFFPDPYDYCSYILDIYKDDISLRNTLNVIISRILTQEELKAVDTCEAVPDSLETIDQLKKTGFLIGMPANVNPMASTAFFQKT